MKETTKIYRQMILALAGPVLLAAGCSKLPPEETSSPAAGQPISFSVAPASLPCSDASDAPTRSIYRGKTEDYVGDYQTIDWVPGDKIRVYSPDCTVSGGTRHWADYIVTPSDENGRIGIVPANGLVWGEPGTYRFYCIYPSPETEEEDFPEGANGTVRWTIPRTQTAKPTLDAPMIYGREFTYTGSEKEVRLESLTCMFTAFEFDLKTNSEEVVTLNSITLSSSSDQLAGPGRAEFHDGEDFTYYWDSDGSSSYYKVSLACGQTLPVRCNTYVYRRSTLSNMSLTIDCTSQGVTKQFRMDLKKNGEWLSFAHHQKHLIKGLVTPIFAEVAVFNAQAGEWQTFTSTNTVLNF